MSKGVGDAAAEAGVHDGDLFLSGVEDLVRKADLGESGAVVEGEVGELVVLHWWGALRRHGVFSVWSIGLGRVRLICCCGGVAWGDGCGEHIDDDVRRQGDASDDGINHTH